MHCRGEKTFKTFSLVLFFWMRIVMSKFLVNNVSINYLQSTQNIPSTKNLDWYKKSDTNIVGYQKIGLGSQFYLFSLPLGALGQINKTRLTVYYINVFCAAGIFPMYVWSDQRWTSILETSDAYWITFINSPEYCGKEDWQSI